MLISCTIRQTFDSKQLLNILLESGVEDITEQDIIDQINGREQEIDLTEQLKSNPGIRIGMIQLFKSAYSTKPTGGSAPPPPISDSDINEHSEN